MDLIPGTGNNIADAEDEYQDNCVETSKRLECGCDGRCRCDDLGYD